MASESRDFLGPEEAAEEEEVIKLEEEVDQMAQKLLDCRTTLPPQLTSTTSSLLQSQRPSLPTHLLDTESRVSQGLMREMPGFPVADNPDEAGKIQLLKQKISSSAAAMPALLSRMKEYMARIHKLDSCTGIIHPAFTRNRTG